MQFYYNRYCNVSDSCIAYLLTVIASTNIWLIKSKSVNLAIHSIVENCYPLHPCQISTHHLSNTMKLVVYLLLGIRFSAVRAADPQANILPETDAPGLRGGVNVTTDVLMGQALQVDALEAAGEPLSREGKRSLFWGSWGGCSNECNDIPSFGTCQTMDRCRYNQDVSLGWAGNNPYLFTNNQFHLVTNVIPTKDQFYLVTNHGNLDRIQWMCGDNREWVTVDGAIYVWAYVKDNGRICWFY